MSDLTTDNKLAIFVEANICIYVATLSELLLLYNWFANNLSVKRVIPSVAEDTPVSHYMLLHQ